MRKAIIYNLQCLQDLAAAQRLKLRNTGPEAENE
jgi:hypothetical protein